METNRTTNTEPLGEKGVLAPTAGFGGGARPLQVVSDLAICLAPLPTPCGTLSVSLLSRGCVGEVTFQLPWASGPRRPQIPQAISFPVAPLDDVAGEPARSKGRLLR